MGQFTFVVVGLDVVEGLQGREVFSLVETRQADQHVAVVYVVVLLPTADHHAVAGDDLDRLFHGAVHIGGDPCGHLLVRPFVHREDPIIGLWPGGFDLELARPKGFIPVEERVEPGSHLVKGPACERIFCSFAPAPRSHKQQEQK